MNEFDLYYALCNEDDRTNKIISEVPYEYKEYFREKYWKKYKVQISEDFKHNSDNVKLNIQKQRRKGESKFLYQANDRLDSCFF